MTEIRACIDKFIDPIRAAEVALKENPDNRAWDKDLADLFLQPGTHSRDVRAAGVILTGRKWPNGKTLKVAFMGGGLTTNFRVQNTAQKWEKYVNIHFDFVSDPAEAEIRIAYDKNDGSWSYLGTSNLEIPKNEPTMNFGWLEPNTSQTEYDRVVLHEFGHALGYPHEHQHPRHDIPWDEAKVYEYYMRTQGWSREDVYHQLFERYSESQTTFSEFDKQSIMLYPIPNDLTIGDYEVGWNTEISEGDKKFAEWQYPKDIVPNKPPSPPVSPPIKARVKVSLSTLYRSPSKYYDKDLTIESGRRARWDADSV